MKLLNTSLVTLSLLMVFISCKKEKATLPPPQKNTIKYAKGFEIESYPTYKKLIIKAPYPNAKEQFTFILLPKENKTPLALKNKQTIISVPIQKIVATSTTHIPMLELLEAEQYLVGFPNVKYISSKKTQQLITQGKITELGNEQDINIEILLNLQPDAVVGFSISSNNKMFASIKKAGIPVLLNGDWLEETPLGRAEWIKFFGVLFNKEKEADSIFTTIEHDYIEAKNIAKNAVSKPTVLSGGLFKDIWNMPAGDSFMAQFLKDANTNYLWSNSQGKGSLSLHFENVLDKGKHADVWIAPGSFETLKQVENANEHYTAFDAFKTKKIYSFALKKGANGGLLYFELAPVQPHIILKDIIKATHPELLTNYQPFFLEKLN